MASGGAEEGNGGIPLDIDNVHMLLQVEHDQIQKRTFTNWINAQLAKGCPPSFVSDLFSDLRDGSKLLDLLEVMSGQMMKRQKGHGVFQQRANIETALKFLKKKNVKLVNINIPDIIDGRPSIILGLVWTIILHCHIEELASALSFSSRHSSLDSLSSLDSWSGSPVPASPVPAGRTSPLHRRFRMSAKKVLLMWVRDQCKKVHCSVNVKDFKSSWRSGEVFLAILCSLRPQLVDLSLVQSRSNQENLEEAFHLAEQELHIPRLLEPQDVDVSDPDEKSIMTYVAQFLQYSSDVPAPDDHLQLFPLVQPSFCSLENLPAHFTPAIAVSPLHEVSPCERAQHVTCWLQQADQELSDSWKAAENSSYAEKYQVLQSFTGSFTEQRRAVMNLLAALRHRPELNQQQCTLKTAWDHLEEELQRCKADLDLSLPPPLDSVAAWLKHAEAGLAEDAGSVKDHADAAKEARAQQDILKILNKEMSYYVKIVETYHNMDVSGNVVVPPEKFDEIRKRLTNIRVSAKYHGIRLEYQESHHTVLDLLSQISAKVQSWKAPCRSQESVHVLLQDWHETIEHQDPLFLLTNAFQTLKEKANVYTSKAALSENFQLVNRQVKEAEREVETVRQAVTAARGTMERVVSAWETYSKSLASLQAWLAQEKHFQAQTPAAAQDISEWASCQAHLNEAGNFLIDVTESSTSLSLAEQLSKVNMQWAEYVKKAMFEVSSEPCAGASCLQMVHSLTQEASLLLRQPLEVASVPLKAIRQKLQLLSKKMAEVNVSSLSSLPDFQTSHLEKLQKTLPQMLVEAAGACGELQQAASRLEGGLAELDRWSTDALDSYTHQKEKSHRGHSTLVPTTKGLISRGLQLANWVKTEEMDLQSLVARLQKTSPLQHLSTSSLKDRITEAVSRCQEILGMLSSLGLKQEAGEFPENRPPFKTIFETHKQSEMGLLVVARTKHVDNTGNIMPQSQHTDQLSAHTPQQRTRDPQGKVHEEKYIITSNIVANSSSVTPLVPTAKEAESEFLIQPQSFSKLPALASGFGQNDLRPPATTQTPVRIKCSEIPVLSKHGASSFLQFQTETAGPSSVQSNKPPQPPVVVHSEVHSRAQSMARSRLEKARFRLQGRIQQAMKLFGGKEISESEAKKKQKALKILQPAMLEEFLCAVEGFGAFCSGPQLQDLMLLSDTVRKQWEDVCREMAAFIPILWSEIREGKQSFSVVRCEMHTNAFSEATAQTDRDSLQQQAVTEGAASIEERAESLRELCETLTPKKSSCLATDQLRESDEVEETQPSDTAIPADSRGGQPGGDAPLSATDVSADTQPSNNLLQKQSGDGPHEDRSSVCYAVPVQPHGDILKPRVQDVPSDKKTDSGSEQNPKPSLRAKEQLLKARLLHIAESSQQTQTHTQAVVRSNTVETKQEAERTVIPESAAGAQGEHPSEQEVQESYSEFCSAFKSQLQKNELLLETFIPDPVSILELENQKKHLQTLIQETEALWFDVELQYARFSQFPQLMTKEEGWSEVEIEQGQLTQQWREQQVCLQTRLCALTSGLWDIRVSLWETTVSEMASLENIADLMKSADDQKTLITQKLNKLIGESVDISSLTLADSTLLPDLKEMDSRLQAGIRKLSEKGIKEERQGPEATSSPSFGRGLHNSFHHFEQLRQQLEKLQSAVWALDCFLATVREVKTEIQTVLASQHLSRQKQQADWEQDRHSLRAVMQRLQAATVQSDSVDSSLKAVGMTLTMDGAPVTCQDVVKSVTEHVVEIEKQDIQEHEELKTVAIWQTKSGNASLQQQEVQEDPSASEANEESGLEAKRCKLEGENETKTQREEEHTTQTWRLGEDVAETKDQRQRRKSSLVKKQGEKKESLVQRRAALLATLMETKKEAEQLNLQEPTLPALQQRIRALTELESRLADLLSEVQYIQGALSQSGTPDQSQTREVDDLWEETSRAVTERLEQCGVLTELLKRFQSIRGELSVTLQRAESTISEQASYMGKDNLQRLYTKVQETKAELNGLGDGIEEVRSVCRQIHTHSRQIPECTFTPFESEADALMDRWLDLSERTDSCLENVHLALSLWDGVLQLGTEVEHWTSDKVAVFAQCPSFRSEDDIKALQNETVIQEERIQHFHRRATEIQTLLQSTESPLELQVVETQMRKKLEELKELISEAEDVYKQMVITKGQITGRMGECFNSLQKIQDSLLTLSGPDVAAVLGKLKEISNSLEELKIHFALMFRIRDINTEELCRQLQSQDEQAESLLEDVHVMASITCRESLQSLSVEGIQLQEKVRNTHQLFSEVEEQTERNIRDLDRLQTEKEHLEQWLHAAEEKAAKGGNLSLLQEEALQQRVRTELLSQLVSSLQSSNLQQLAVVEDSKKLLERYHNFYTNIPGDSKETRSSLREDIEVFRALSKSAQSWIRDLRHAVDSALVESPGIQTPLEQKLHCAQAVLNATFEGEARLEELRVTGDDLCRRALNQDDLKQEVQETLQRSEEQWRGTLQSVEPYYSALKADPEVTSLYLAQRQEACCKVEELQHQTDQLPTFFPWPSTAERKQAYRLAHQLQEEIESLQLTLTSMSERRHELTEQTSNSIWKDSSWAELDTRCSALMAELKDVCFRLEEGASNEEHFGQLLQHCYHKLMSLQERMSACQAQKEISAGANTDVVALEALLQEVTDIEKDLLQLASLKDSIKVSSIAEAQASLTQQVSNLQNHKRALESSIRETLAQLKVNRDGSIQQVIEEASYVQTALKDLAEGVKSLFGISEALPDISQLKQQWCTIQDCGSRLTELAARAEELQRTRESSSTQETLPADIILTVSAMFGDLGSLRSIFLQKKQHCAENTANRVRETISQLQEWSQRIQAEPSIHSQETLDEGLQLQQALYKVLSEQNFLFNCLGTNDAQKLEKSASATLTVSQSALDSISKHLAIPVCGSVHLENKDLPSRSEQESGVPHSASNGKTLAKTLGLTASPFSCATDSQENSGSDQNDNKIKTKGTEPPAETSGGLNVEADAVKQDQAGVVKTKDDVLAQIQVACSETPVVLKTQIDPHHLTPQEVLLKSYLGPKDNSVRLYTDSSSQSSISENDTGPLVSDSHPNLNKNLIAQEENTPLQNDITLTSLSKLSAVGADNTKATDSAHCVPSLIELPPTKPDSLLITDPESVSEHLEVQLETFEANTNAQKNHCKDTGVTTKKVFTVVLDVDPQDMWRKENSGACSREAPLSDEKHTKYSSTEFPEIKTGLFMTSKSQESDKDMQHCSLAAHQSETSKAITSVREKENFCEDVSVDMQKRENANASSPDTPRYSQEAEFSTARPTEVSSRVFPENKSGLFTTSISPESDEIDFQNHCESPESSPSVLVNTVWEKVNCVSAELPCKENHKAHGLKHNEVLKSSKSCFPGAECQLAGAHAAETTFPDVKPKETTDFCDSGEQTVSTAEDLLESGEALNDTQISATGKKQVTPDNTVCSADTACEEVPKGENTEEANDLESTECKGSEVPERRDIALLPKGRSERKLPAALEDMGVTQTQPQIPESMEPERTALGSAADLGSKEVPAGSGNSCKHRSTMWEILSEIQNVVERSNIINRTSHTDLNWYLRSSPGEPEIQLVRTVQKILACRYQPARLSVTAMAKQLEEAKEYQHAVQEQVGTLKNSSADRFCEPSDLKSAEDQWSAALLDASATVQVKAAQLDQVKQYHRQMKITRAFLEVVAAEKGKMSLNTLGSSALQAEKLHVLLHTMEQKKDMMEDLLRLSSRLSVHLSDAESSGALLAQLGDVQEEWRLLKGSLNRALRHASNSTCQSSLFLKEAEQLKAKLEALQKFDCQNFDSKCSLEFVCLTTDLKLYNQLYLHLQSQSDALINFSLGQKEKDEIRSSLQGLASLLSVTKKKLDSLTFSSGDSSSTKINNQLRELIVWAKQAENHISIGKKLALFPEEARIQIVEMKKFQTDILSRQSKMRVQVEEMKELASNMENEETDQVLKTVEDLYEAIADSLDLVLDTMKKDLQEREKLLCVLASMDACLAETHAKRDPCTHVHNVSKADLRKLESDLKSHQLATAEIESQLKLVEEMSESCRKIAIGLSPAESRYLVNRLSGLWTELDGLLAHEKATSWELEELIHERTASDRELSTIQASLKQISADLEQLKFPLTEETLSVIAQWKHMLMEHQCQAQELQHCLEAKRSSLLCCIGELQDRFKALNINVFEQEKYLKLRTQMEESRDIVKGQIQDAKNKAVSLDERFRLCQTVLVELPLVKTQCQEAADQLEVIAQELDPSVLNSERERIHHTVETLLSWEHRVTDDIKNLEAEFLPGLRFNSELPTCVALLESTRVELEGAKPVSPDEAAIDIALQRYWVIWRNMESGIRMLENLGQKEKIDPRNYKELYSLRDSAMQEFHSQMVTLSQARESLKDYHWAAQGAISFLHNAEATFLSAPGGFLDCAEEQKQTKEALEALEEGFQAHICHFVERVPQQPCLSRLNTEQLHINILSQLLVGRAILEAQAQLRLESLQRCELTQQSHKKCHEDICQHLSQFEDRLSQCAAEHVTSYDKCVAQQRRAQLLVEDLHSLAGRIDDLRAGCPMQGCGVGKDGEVGAFWRCWVSLRRGVGLLMARTEQRGEEWKDITTSMEKCCSSLVSLQTEVRDSATVNFTREEPQELLALAEMHQTGLEQEQQALASLEHRLEHALSLSSSQDFITPGPIGKMLVKIQDNVRSLQEQNLLVVAAAQAEDNERQQVQEQIGEIQKHVLVILPALEVCLNPSERQELRKELSSQKTKLKCIMDSVQSRYAKAPADIGKQIQDLQVSLQRAEEKLIENSLVKKLASRVLELGSGMEKVKALLEQRSPTVSEAQNVLKHVWDELDAWHSSLMLLESEVQDLAEERPDQAQLLIDQLTQPQQLYQDAAQMVEQRTTFLSKIPKCLQELEDILCSATRWLDEAQSWLTAPCSFTTTKSLQNHAKSLQLVLDDSEMIRHNLQAFRSVLAEISAVCDITTQEERLEQNDHQVLKMQGSILEPLEQLLQAVAMVEGLEAELKTVEKNVPKIRTILSSIDDCNITLTEHLHNRQVILANVHSMRRTLEEIERCKGELHIPLGAEEGLQVHSRGKLLLQSLEELELQTRQQTSLLEDKIRAEEEAGMSLGITAVSQEMDRSLQRHLVQGAFEVFYSEEEEDEDDRSCHSSSSDTLTSSIPEDPEETLTLSDVQEEGMAEHKLLSDIKDLESLVPQSSSGDAEKPESDGNLGSKCVETGIITPDSTADFDKALSPGSVTAQSRNTATIPAAEGQFKAAVVDQQDSPKHEAFDADPRAKTPQVAAAVGDTRLIPSRPITPFTAGGTSDDLIDEEEDDPSLSTAPNPNLDVFNRLKEQTEVSTRCLLEGSQQPQQYPEEPISLAGHENVNHEGQRWSHLHSKISEKLTTLKKVKEERQSQICREDGGTGEKVPDELISPGSTGAVLQQIQESTTVLRQIVSSADGSHAGLKEEFYEAARGVLLCLDSFTGLLLTRDSAGEDESHLRLLQQECVSAELGTLSQLMSKVESETRPALSKEEPDAYSCLTCLQDCLHTAQLALTSSHNQLIEDPGLKDLCQELSSNQLCLLDEFGFGQSQIFPNLKDTPSLECVLGRHLRESPGEKAKLQHSSRSLLQGITRLLELGEECTRERKMSQVQSRSKLQAVLCRNKKLLQVLRSQMAFVQYLFQHEPEALKCQEDERVQLEVRAKSLQQQALEQEVASQRRLQEWTRWEDNCGRLGRVLDESEAFISRWEPEGDDDKEELVQHRLDACQKMLVQLDDSKAALGVILDQGKVLQAEPLFAASAHQAGGALELRWKSTYRLTEQEIQHCRNIQDARVRFQTNFDSVSEWLAGANDHLKTLSGLADTSDVNQECVKSSLIKLLDFSMEVEGMSLLKASVSKDAAQLLQLKEADCPGPRTQLTQLENSWNRLTSDMSKTQGQLQQCLLAAQPSAELLCDLEDWLKQMQSCMNQEKEKALKASSAAQVTKILQHFQAFKAAVTNGQLLLDFLCQPGPQMADVQALRSERTMFAEKLGAFRLQWLHFQRELESQISGAEQIHSTCAERERRLQCLHVWIEQQKKQLNQWKQPTSQTLAQKALLEWEALQGGVKEVATALQELKTTRVHEKKEDEHPCAFSNEAESVSHACRDLSQQIEALRPALQQVVEKWSCFHRDLRDVTLHTTRVHCAFQHQQAPLFSLKQAEGYMDFLQQLQEEAGKGEALWAALDKSCQNLVGSLHHGAAQALRDEVEGERKRWKNMVQEIKDENIKTGETLSLWQEYAGLSDSCSAQLEHLLREWEELSSSSLTPGQDTQGLVWSVKKLEDGAKELQSSMGDVLASSKPLIGRLEPLPANLIQSETRLLSRGILLLNKAVSGKKKSLQEDLEQLKLFHTQLEALEKQTQNLQHKLQAGIHDTDSVQQVLQELSESLPSLLDLREMSGCVSLNNQETERLHMLSREWVESMTRTSDRELQAECQRSLSFQEKSRRLTQIKEKLQQESVCRKNQSYLSLQEMLAVHQRLQADITVGHQLLQGLLCDAVTSMEKETGEKRSELMAQVVCLKDGWFSSVGLACQNRTLTKEQLRQWRIYSRGLRRLWKLLRDTNSLLPPTGRFLCTLDQLQNCVNDYQCVTESLDLHSTVYTQTLEAGRHLCETMTDSECQSRLQSELQAIEEAWERTTSPLRERRDLVHTTVKMSCQCQEGIISIVSELDKLKLKQQTSERPDDSALIQETELSLQRLNTGLRELATMKTDLSQYVAASDSALLEQQLEQLHSQWEELCTKVSSRKQEIADRLNAWTIFNDKNKEFCDWLTHMENKVCHCGDLSIKEMVEKLKKDCMEEINLFSENKSHLKQLGEQLLLASDEAKQTQVHESLQEVNQRWHNLFHQIEARVKKLKETLVTMQQLDKNMSNLRSWLSRIEAELSRPITYSVCHEQEIQRRLAEQQELQRDIEQHTEGVASVLSLCDVLLRDEDAAGGAEVESDSLQETSRSLDQRWRTICAMALDRRLRIEETWTLWCKFLDDYSRFEDWLKMAERTASNPNSADVLFAVAKEELKKFEGFQRQVHEQLTHLELVNNQYRRLARENRTDRASQLKAMVHEGNRRWDALHRRVAAILRRLKHFTSQREEFEGTRESLVVWLTDLDLQLTNVEHFSESDVHHKIQQLNSFQREITLNTERIDGLIVFGEGLIQKSSPQDAEKIEEELEELHSYCQEVFGRLVRFHQRLSQPPMITEEPELSGTTFSLESSLELIGRPWLGRSLGSLPATPTHLLSSPLERSGRETPDSLPLEWDHTVDVGGSSSHEDDEEEEGREEEAAYFSALSEAELTENQEEFIEASEAPLASSLVSGRSVVVHETSRWPAPGDRDTQFDTEGDTEATPTLTSTPLKPGYLHLMSQCSRSIESINRVSLILDGEEQPEEFGLTGLATSDKQSGVIERWELLQAQSRCGQQAGPEEPQQLSCDLDNISSWLENVIPQLDRLQKSDPAASIEEMEARAKELKEMQKMFTHYKSIMLSVNLRAGGTPDAQEKLMSMNRDWSRACTALQQWDTSLRKKLMQCQEFHESLHSLLLWLAHAESRRYAVDISHPDTTLTALQQHSNTLTALQKELRGRQTHQASLQALWSQLQPEDGAEESDEAREKLHVTGSKLKMLLKQVDTDLIALQQRLDCDSAMAVQYQNVSQEAEHPKKGSSTQREKRESSPPRSFFYRALRAAFPLHLLLLLLLLLPCLIPMSEIDSSCTVTNNFARSFYPMLHYTNGPPPT